MVILIVIVGFFTFSKLFAKNKITASALELPSDTTISLTDAMALEGKDTTVTVEAFGYYSVTVKFTNLTGGNNRGLINIREGTIDHPVQYLYGMFKFIGEDNEEILNSELSVTAVFVDRDGSTKFSNKPIYYGTVIYLTDVIFDFTPVLTYQPDVFYFLRNLSEIRFSIGPTTYSPDIISYIAQNYTFEYYITQYNFSGIVNYNYQLGYSEGYEAGLSAGSNADVEQAYQMGYNAGYSAGVNYASGVSYNQGYNVGYSKGYNEGYQTGLNAGNQVSYENGYNEGYQAGLNAGYSEGYSEGDLDGYNRGTTEGYENGYDEGYSVGYNSGYDFGFVEGQNSDVNATSFLGGIINGVVGILNINVLPGFSLGMLITIPLVLGLFFWLFKLIGGGGD